MLYEARYQSLLNQNTGSVRKMITLRANQNNIDMTAPLEVVQNPGDQDSSMLWGLDIVFVSGGWAAQYFQLWGKYIFIFFSEHFG